jgi:hypothetical protein
MGRSLIVAALAASITLSAPAHAQPNPNPPDPGKYLYGLRSLGITANQIDDKTALDTGYWLCGQTGDGKGPALATTLQTRFPGLRRNQAEGWVADSDWICPNNYLYFPEGTLCPGRSRFLPPAYPGMDCDSGGWSDFRPPGITTHPRTSSV